MIQSFFANGQFLGSRPIANWLRDRDNGIINVSNLALWCPQCGEVWARVTVDQPKATWNFHARTCRNCPPGAFGPAQHGCISDPAHWKGSALNFTDDWPEGAVRWEFESLMRNFKEPQP